MKSWLVPVRAMGADDRCTTNSISPAAPPSLCARCRRSDGHLRCPHHQPPIHTRAPAADPAAVFHESRAFPVHVAHTFVVQIFAQGEGLSENYDTEYESSLHPHDRLRELLESPPDGSCAHQWPHGQPWSAGRQSSALSGLFPLLSGLKWFPAPHLP